ncbi:hypothetical protein D0Z07_2764 [Hyphodiscus hymeniophilus]|uniref:BAH domain-containing protein n=1 Tax=Hyphodiscus hymeniophilus TaxID=353542 RepID=A0A9P7AYF1_9HELO|nr:hypothetical protein D0Z07_2764 [Hyphodiscus hymeniophilus]
MAPKRGIDPPEPELLSAKRAKSSATPNPDSRSATPLDQGKIAFEVKYLELNTKKKLSKKERDLSDSADFMESPFVAQGASKPGELDQYYTVVPSEEWDSMKKYNNFIIQGEVYKNNQFVFVRGENTPKDKTVEDPKDFWVARILQVRAKNAQHVYALVTWLYWPDELPAPKKPASDQVSAAGGKRTYHGSHELIPSNYMDVLDVLSFAGKAEVGHWLEEDDNLPYKLYWRQTFCRETQELSKIREHCVCGGHFNPEVAMDICENDACKTWLHEKCIIDNVLTTLCDGKTENKVKSEDSKVKLERSQVKTENGGSVEPDTNGSTSKTSGKKFKTDRKVWEGKFKGKLIPGTDKTPTTISITELRTGGRGTWTERVLCPKCGTLLE